LATTFVQSILRILGGTPIVARVGCPAPIATAGAHRRELAQAAHKAIEAALGIQEAGPLSMPANDRRPRAGGDPG
jgi:hypothetical protein